MASFRQILRLKTFTNMSMSRTRQLSSQSTRLVETEVVGKVFMVAINRPEVKNCVNVATAAELIKAFDHFEQNDDLWVAVLHGKGGTFCAGYDLSELSQRDKDSVTDRDTVTNHNLDKGHGPMGPSRMMFSKPVIAAVNGYAVAGGIELALMCDLRVMDESAIMGVFCRRFGVPLLDGGTVRLPQLIGLSRALDVILTGRPITAQEALDMGLANRVVKTGTAITEALKLAESLCQFPQECMRADRRSAFNSTFNAASMKEAFDYEIVNGAPVVVKESIAGAGRFKKGVGRHGDFNLQDRDSKSKL